MRALSPICPPLVASRRANTASPELCYRVPAADAKRAQVKGPWRVLLRLRVSDM